MNTNEQHWPTAFSLLLGHQRGAQPTEQRSKEKKY